MLPLGTILPAVAPGHWSVVGTPDAKAAVVAAFRDATDRDAVWAQLGQWSGALHSAKRVGLAVPVPLRLPDGVPGIAYDIVPWRVGADGLTDEPTAQHVTAVLRSLAGTLDALHADNVTHGALGLASLWWTSPEQVLLPDVGLAHTLDGLMAMPAAAAAYHAPEIWRGASPSPASDQYALAIIALELFTGTPRMSVSDVEGIVAFEPVVVDTHSALFRGTSRKMIEVFQRALSAAPSARFASCTEFVEALEGHVVHADTLRTFHQPLHRRARGRVTWRGVGFTCVAVGVIATAFMIARTKSSPSQIVESVAERLPNLGSVESILPSPTGSPLSVGDRLGSRQRGGSIVERDSGRDDNVERPAIDPDPSSVRRNAEGTETEAAPDAGAPDGPRSALNARTAGTVGAEVTAPVAPNSTVASVLLPNVTPDSALVAPGTVDVIGGAFMKMVRVVTGASEPLTGQQAVASAALARGGTIRFDVPAGSRVYLDGVLLAAPTSNVTASPGPHDVDVLFPGATESQRRRVTVTADDTTVLRLRAP